MENCEILKYIQGGFAEIAMSATSLLFFCRLKAVYRESRVIVTIFGIFWLLIAGLSIFVLVSVTASE